MMQNIDYLIVGQGVAGTLLAHFLLENGQDIRVVDLPMPGATSRIAAGIVNPVTGRRLVLSWHYPKLYPFAKQTYLGLESKLGIKIWEDRKIFRALHHVFEENEWERRSAFPENGPFYESSEADVGLADAVQPAHAWGITRQAAQVHLPALVQAYRQFLREKSLLLEAGFRFESLILEEKTVVWEGLRAKKIVFCEGHHITQNPFFNYLPFVPTKGDLLLVKLANWPTTDLVKHELFVVPLPNGLFWVGSTNETVYTDVMPSARSFEKLQSKLKSFLKIPFEVVAHQSGIRPTVIDRRPTLGIHPSYPPLAVFNGLGTKGASLGPFFANEIAQHLLNGQALDEEVDIRRFLSTPAAQHRRI